MNIKNKVWSPFMTSVMEMERAYYYSHGAHMGHCDLVVL